MKRIRSVMWGAAAVVVAAGAWPASAEPLNASLVPADAKWIVHMDFDALRESALGQAMLDEAEARGADAKLAKLSEVVGFDVADNLRGATLYGDGFDRESTAMLITVAGDTGNIEGLMLAAPGYASERKGDRLVHSFMAEDRVRGDARLFVTIEPVGRGSDTMVLAAYDPSLLEAAVARLDGEAGGAGAGEAPDARPVPAPSEGSLLFARVFEVDPDVLRHAQRRHSAVLSTIRDLALDLSEREGQLSLSATAGVVDAQRAEQLRQLIEGGLAMAQLGDQTRPVMALAADLAQLTRVTATDETVSVSLDVATQRVIDSAKKLRGGHDDKDHVSP